ncbi:LLM class flavin-dependent oxidoreductase [Bacillus sp. V2I10]|uniref:LLM class flavin-dependent oxidoreductase n=1 Tax=Bacillus sp. V2I10 TaxID=3042276 RepID=UPI00278AB73E|nr:alkanesulfonate monooxygenase SsuD/methylene tetrahydromethanopterin reductase-like flavin-dependent oxidoreductase (luciferase family) [Bacillus sp. V2I10]
MKFFLFSLINNLQNPVSGETLSAQQKFQSIIKQATYAEKHGFEGFGVGERHGPPFLSSSPAVILSAIAAQTSNIRLMNRRNILH